MIYDFDRIIDRTGTFAAKYDERFQHFGTEDVLPLWIADMDFPTAKPIIDALTRRAQEGIWGYTSRPDSYFAAICDWQLRRNDWKIDPALCSYALGVIPAIGSMIQCFTQPGDRVLIQPPVYGDFSEITVRNGREVAENHLILDEGGTWRMDREDFLQKIKTVKMFLLCSPHNPLGFVWSREDLEFMVEQCIANHVILISDEIHSDLIFSGKHIPAASLSPAAANYVITCISATKTFNMAGLQVSTTVFPNQELKARFDQYWKDLEIHRNNAFSLIATEVAYRQGEEWLEQLKDYLRENFHFVHDYCEKRIPGIHTNLPQATYLMWLDCRQLGLSQEALCRFMIEKAHLGLNSASAFSPSLAGFMRLNAACPRAVLRQAMEQLEAAVKSL